MIHLRLIYLCYRVLFKFGTLCQNSVSVILKLFHAKYINCVGDRNIEIIYLGSKVFSCYSLETRRDVRVVDIATIQVAPLDNSILIINNNDIQGNSCYYKLSNIKKRSSNLRIVVWDFDNHHLPANSFRLMNLSDVYFSAHIHNFDFFRASSSKYFGILNACVIQWPRKLLTLFDTRLKSGVRSDELFGPHVFYPQFERRNKIIEFVSGSFPKVCFTNLNYHKRGMEDRLSEWCNYKIHFVAPVDNDLPIRLLDALVTGGIPLVPIRLKCLLHSLSLDTFVVFYDDSHLDLLHLRVEEALCKFDDEGVQGISRRVGFVLDNHHIDSRINFLINFER